MPPPAATQAAARLWTARVARKQFKLTVSYDVSGSHGEYMTHQLLDAVHTRACTGIKKNAHKSVTVQNRTHFHMNFFDHKNLGNHLLQLCPKVVKHPVYGYDTYLWAIRWHITLCSISMTHFFPLRRSSHCGLYSGGLNFESWLVYHLSSYRICPFLGLSNSVTACK